MADDRSGHVTVPHTADLRIEAWAPTRDGCIRQAMLGTVEDIPGYIAGSSAADVPAPTDRWTATRTCSSPCSRKSSTCLDTVGEAPVDLTLTGIDGDVDVARVDARTLAQVGAVPKALSLNELRFSHGQKGWRGAVTLDV